MALFSNPAKDAKKIQDKIDYRVLKAAWDSYAHINAGKLASTYKRATPAWFALFAIQNYNGNFSKFSEEELHLLESLTTVGNAYDKIIICLEENHENEELGRYILSSHPNLQEAVPSNADNVEKIIIHIASVIKEYKAMLEKFYDKHKSSIENTIEKLSNKC